jgi:hypothetical protein
MRRNQRFVGCTSASEGRGDTLDFTTAACLHAPIRGNRAAFWDHDIYSVSTTLTP